MRKLCVVNSNDGWQKVSFFCSKKSNDNDFFLLSIDLEFKYWDRLEQLDGNFETILPDRHMKYSQLCISKNKWNTFIESIEGWKNENEIFSIQLIENGYEDFNIEVNDKDENLIASLDKPVFSISTRDARQSSEYKLIVDKTSFSDLFKF